jgi:cobalt-zinc-cadmium efflux system protein
MSHSHPHSRDSDSGLKLAFLLNLGFAVFEVFGGIWINSLAILSDALHDFTDSLSLGLSWYLARYSQKQSADRYSYGYRRFSLLGALINVVVLIAGSLLILSEAIPRLGRPERPSAQGMLLFGIVGILVNGLAALRLRGGRTANARVATWHLLEDVLGWAAVLGVSVVLRLRDLPILDPILSILVTAYVFYNAIAKFRQTLSLFLQAVPEEISVDQIERGLLAIDGVESVHHTHVWSLDGEHHVLTTHVMVNEDRSRDEVCQIKNRLGALTAGLNIEHTTVEIEYEGERRRMRGQRNGIEL